MSTKKVSFITKINDNWKAWAVIGGIIVVSIGGWNYAMAQVEKTAEAKVNAVINKAMIEGAKEASKQAVKDELPAISRQVAIDVVNELKKEQMIRPAPIAENKAP